MGKVGIRVDGYPTEEKTKVGKETHCSSCCHDVEFWSVWLEPDGEGGYEKKHRCPHCGELSIEDQVLSGHGSTFIFFAAFFTTWIGIICIGQFVWGEVVPENSPGTLVYLFGMLIGGLAGIAAMSMHVSLTRWLKLRFRPAKNLPNR